MLSNVNGPSDDTRTRRGRWRLSTIVVVAAALVSSHGIQATRGFGAEPQRSLFRSAVDLVTLHVTVTDRSGNYLTDVDNHEFMVFENGRRQALTMFQPGGLPLAVALVLDTSSSVRHAFSEVQETAVAFLRQLKAHDVACVMSFSDSIARAANVHG